ncbi:uncharacterized protein PG986_002283 [Apiospora aurea]|uniref:Uncharacterized protein n=1 Tax=Apiospora aurea TaxID=335848 RepID=A0ABR1QZ66_9PEZI
MAAPGTSLDAVEASLQRKAKVVFQELFRVVSAVEANRHGPVQRREGDPVLRHLDQLSEDDPVLRDIKDGTDSIYARLKPLLATRPQDAEAQTEIRGNVKLIVETRDKGQQTERSKQDRGTQTLSTQPVDLTEPKILDRLSEDVGILTEKLPREILIDIMEVARDTFEFIHLKYGPEPREPSYHYWLDCPNLNRINAMSKTNQYMRYFSSGTDEIARTADLESLSDASVAFFKSLFPGYDVSEPFPKFNGLPDPIRSMLNTFIILGHQEKPSIVLWLQGVPFQLNCNPSKSLVYLDGFVDEWRSLSKEGIAASETPDGYVNMLTRFPHVLLKIDEVFNGLCRILAPDEHELAAPVLGGANTLDNLIEAWRWVLGPIMS